MNIELKADLSPQKLFYELGRRDLAADILCRIRLVGVDKTLNELAKALLEQNSDHPHAKWFLDTATRSENN